MPVIVRMGEYAVIKGKGQLVTNGLGSCVGLALYDAKHKVAGLAHIMLPKMLARPAKILPPIGKYADTAIAAMLKRMCGLGSETASIEAKLAGGAHMFQQDLNQVNMHQSIGARNVESCKALLKQYGIPLKAEDTGGNYSRTIIFSCDTGVLQIRNTKLGLKEI